MLGCDALIRVIDEKDISLIQSLFKRINRGSKEEIDNIIHHIDTTKIIVANIQDGEISSLSIANLIKNDYYLEDVIFINNDKDEVRALLKYMVETLRSDNRGLSIIYDNIPYRESMHQIMIELGFKCNFINYETSDNRIELIRSNIVINEITDEVREYMLRHFEEEYKLIEDYLGGSVNQYNPIDISKTNIAVAKDKDEHIVGVLRFGLITDSIYISNVYADSKEVMVDLINLVKNLTNRKIEIGIYPIREDLLSVLNENAFRKSHSDYKYEF